MTQRLPVAALDTTGAAPGDFLGYDAASGQVIYQAPPGGIQSIVAGANITIDDTDPANPIISATGGAGGSGSSPGYPDDPAMFGADLGYDVEFEATGSALPAGWSWFNQGTSSWETKNGLGLLTPQLGAGSDGGQRFILRNLPTEATWTAVAKTTGVVPRSSGNTHVGLVLRNSANGQYTGYGKRKGGSVARLNFSALETYVTGSIVEVTGLGESAWMYLAIERVAGGNYNFRYSPNGITWEAHSLNVAPYSAFNQIGLWVQSATGTNNEPTPHPFAWFRVR